ncbi:MAG: hypothetical protein VXW65_07650 [Pseudomonadota bacterium]|nr:hypothetical protein [Pseudomonadota bacterium]
MLAELQRLHTLIDTLTRQLQETRMQNEALSNRAPPEPDQRVKDELLKVINQKQQLQTELEALTNRYESLALAHQTMSTEMERIATELAQQALARQQLTTERDILRQKNEHAKQKVEAIIQRLASLGTANTTAPSTSAEATPAHATEQPS